MKKMIPLLLLVLAGCSTHSPTDKPTLRLHSQSILKPGDTIWLFNAKSVERHFDNRMAVDRQGNINLPLVGLIHVAGSTTPEAERIIENAYTNGGFYNKLDVIIELDKTKMNVQQGGPAYPPQGVGSADP
jgi:protein involved in polysaccharide export with SLBB domain